MPSLASGFKSAGNKLGKNLSSGVDTCWKQHGPHEMWDELKSQFTSDGTYQGPLASFITPVINVGKTAIGVGYRTARNLASRAGLEKKIHSFCETVGIDEKKVTKSFKDSGKEVGIKIDDIKNFSKDSLFKLNDGVENKNNLGNFFEMDGFSFIPKDFNAESMAKRVPLNEAAVNVGMNLDPEKFMSGETTELEFTKNKFFDKLGISNKISIAETAANLAENTTNVTEAFQIPFDEKGFKFGDNFGFDKDFSLDKLESDYGLDSYTNITPSYRKDISDPTNTMVIDDAGPMDLGGYTYVPVDASELKKKIVDIDTDAMYQKVDYTHQKDEVFKNYLNQEGVIDTDNIEFNDEIWYSVVNDRTIISEGNLKTGKSTWNRLMDPLNGNMDDYVTIPFDSFEQQIDKSFTGTAAFSKQISDKADNAMSARVNRNTFDKAFEKAGKRSDENGFLFTMKKTLHVEKIYRTVFYIFTWPYQQVEKKISQDHREWRELEAKKHGKTEVKEKWFENI